MKKIKNLLLGSAASLVLVSGISQAEMRIGIDPAPYLPFSAESASGNLEGWEIEIAEAICAAMNEDCVWDKLLGRKRPSFKTTQAAGHVLRSHSLL